jgi:hypothetical protein
MLIAMLDIATSRTFCRGKEMFWGFWKKGSVPTKPLNAQRLGKPQVLPQAVGRELIVQLGKNPDWVWALKSVVRKSPRGKHRYNVRVFDQALAAGKGISVVDYTTLDDHPELILFEGWYDRRSWKARIEERVKPEESLPRAA